MVNILTFTTLYPNEQLPSHGIFVENRLRHLVNTTAMRATVVAPVPYFPFESEAFGKYGAYPRVPKFETRHDIRIYHPRFVLLPKIGMTIAPVLLYLGARSLVRRLAQNGASFDVIDAHYFYPDGVAAALLARDLGKPFVITARGSDLSEIADYALPRRQIAWAAGRASGLVTVCQALKHKLSELGVEESRIQVLRNGVDLDLFQPQDRQSSRAALQVTGTTLLSVGHLIPRKGHDLVIRALADLPKLTLLLVGEGPERDRLQQLANELGLFDRVKFMGHVAHTELAQIYSASDALILASSREGWANVLLESMACGTPVVATDVWGTGEVVGAPEAGVLVAQRTPEALSAAVAKLLAAPPARALTRAYAEHFSWQRTSEGQQKLFASLS